MNDTTPENTKLSWWRRLSSGLKRTSTSLGTAVADLVTKRKLDRAMLAAGVALRAPASEQVQGWGDRTRSTVVSASPGSDWAGLASDALAAAREGAVEVLLGDTAGRLQSKAELMNELEKLVRVIK